jgi:ribosomal protein L7/L12
MTGPALLSALAGVAVALLFIRIASVERSLKRLSRLEAKVDALLKQANITFDAYQDVPPDVREALERGETILAIKRFREATGVDLKEAKQFVDEVRRRRLAPR